MSTSYDDLASPTEMARDGLAAGAHLGLVDLRLEQALRRATRPAPSLHFDEQPGEQPKRDIEITLAAARIAGALHFALE